MENPAFNIIDEAKKRIIHESVEKRIEQVKKLLCDLDTAKQEVEQAQRKLAGIKAQIAKLADYRPIEDFGLLESGGSDD